MGISSRSLPPQVLEVPLHVWQKLMGFIQVCPIEINGFGYLDRLGDTFRMDEDVFILEQTATAGGVDVTAETIARHIYQLTLAGGDSGRMRFQWHSHVNMEAYFSSIDLANIENYGGTWMMSMVANKRGDYSLRLDIFQPLRVAMPVELRIITELPPDIVQECSNEVRQKVRQRNRFFTRQSRPTEAGSIPIDGVNLLPRAERAFLDLEAESEGAGLFHTGGQR